MVYMCITGDLTLNIFLQQRPFIIAEVVQEWKILIQIFSRPVNRSIFFTIQKPLSKLNANMVIIDMKRA